MAKEVKKYEFTTKAGLKIMEKWNPETTDFGNYVAIWAGWASNGKPSQMHISPGQARAAAIAEKRPDLVLHTIQGVPVLDPSAVTELFWEIIDKEMGLEVKKIATSRSGSVAKVKLDAVQTALQGLPKEVLEAMKASGFDPSTI
jgi:hypothetical protein